MYIKIAEYIPNAREVAVYAYAVCDEDGIEISTPVYDFMTQLAKISLVDAQILKSQLNNLANIYGDLGRDERSKGRDGLFAIPDRHDPEGIKVNCRYRLFYWVLNRNTVLIGGGCYKPEKNGDVEIHAYQDVPDCEKAAEELCAVANHVEKLIKKGEIHIDSQLIEVDKEEIIEIR